MEYLLCKMNPFSLKFCIIGSPAFCSFLPCNKTVVFYRFSLIFSCYDSGKTRARDAALNAIQSPLLDIGIERATGIVWNITGGSDLTLFEVDLGSLFILIHHLLCISNSFLLLVFQIYYVFAHFFTYTSVRD